ncbi:MAG: DUF1206 domain-containing protein [Actinomycetota bacterium]|nr:DUF1206 domain-containing protein [Actinomycetota bacterium]
MTSTSGNSGVVDAAASTAASSPMGWIARVGLTARALIYLVMGWLAIVVALGGGAKVDQRGALTKILSQPLGTLLVALMLLGFVAYALWRFSEAAFGVDGDTSIATRGKSLLRAIAYTIIAIGTLLVLQGARQPQAKDQAKLAKAALEAPAGQWILGLVGAGVAIAGLIMIVEGFTTAFLKYFDYLPPARRRAVVNLGRVGTIARGAVFLIAGVLVILGAMSHDPSRAGGINEVVQTTLDLPMGPALVFVMGAGLLIFGVYGLAEAAWRRVPNGDAA